MNLAEVRVRAGLREGVRAAGPLPQCPGIKAPIGGRRGVRAGAIVCPRDGVTGVHGDRARREHEIGDRNSRIAGQIGSPSKAQGIGGLDRHAEIAGCTLHAPSMAAGSMLRRDARIACGTFPSAACSMGIVFRDTEIAGYRRDLPNVGADISRSRSDRPTVSRRWIRSPRKREIAGHAGRDARRRAAGDLARARAISGSPGADGQRECAQPDRRADGDPDSHMLHSR